MADLLSSARILVVDDEPDVLEMVEDILADEVWELTCVRYHDEAKDALENGDYDAAVLDIMGVRGFDLLEAFGATHRCLVMTGHAVSPDTLRQAIERKAMAYVAKSEMSELPRYLRIVLSAPPGLDLWKIWLHPRCDFLNLRRVLDRDFERLDAEVFDDLVYGARSHESFADVVEHPGGVYEIRLAEPPLNLLTPSSVLAYRKLIERLREEPNCRAIVHSSGLPRGLPPEIESGLAERPPLGWLPPGLGRKLARLCLRVVRPRRFRTVVFSAGMSLDVVTDPALLQAMLEFGRDVFMEVFTFPKPFVAALEGPAVAGGMELALCMHYLVADPNASMCLPQLRFGFTPPAAIPLLINRVGVQEAYAICADARLMTAREAHQRGLIDRLVAVGRARETAIAMARRLADRQATTALRLARTLVGFDMRAAVDTSFAEWQRLVGAPVERASVDPAAEQPEELDGRRGADD